MNSWWNLFSSASSCSPCFAQQEQPQQFEHRPIQMHPFRLLKGQPDHDSPVRIRTHYFTPCRIANLYQYHGDCLRSQSFSLRSQQSQCSPAKLLFCEDVCPLTYKCTCPSHCVIQRPAAAAAAPPPPPDAAAAAEPPVEAAEAAADWLWKPKPARGGHTRWGYADARRASW